MPDLHGDEVVDAEARYSDNPAELTEMLERGRRYLYYIVEALEERGMPAEIALLPVVESAFDPLAYSHAHASGLWQFIPSTGRQYRLTQNWWFDARRDVVASTEAALNYLSRLHRMHGDWHLALASYNWGESSVARSIERNRRAGHRTTYQDLTLPEETRRYVPRLQALKNILRNPGHFGIALPPIPDTAYFVAVPLKHNIDLRRAAELADLALEELVLLNPGHNRPVFDPSATPYLVLPIPHVARFLHNLQTHEQSLTSWGTYSVRQGDRLSKIASAHGISLALLRQVNSLSEKAVPRSGSTLLVPVNSAGAADGVLPEALQPLLAAAARLYAPGTPLGAATRSRRAAPI